MGSITPKQNDMIHPVFRDIANGLANEGISIQELIKDSFELIPTEGAIKELTKIIIKQHWGLTSTQQLNTQQIDILIDMWAKKCGKYGVEINLPE
jgi:hypothetical protein